MSLIGFFVSYTALMLSIGMLAWLCIVGLRRMLQ
jgi:hypothetical protein